MSWKKKTTWNTHENYYVFEWNTVLQFKIHTQIRVRALRMSYTDNKSLSLWSSDLQKFSPCIVVKIKKNHVRIPKRTENINAYLQDTGLSRCFTGWQVWSLQIETTVLWEPQNSHLLLLWYIAIRQHRRVCINVHGVLVQWISILNLIHQLMHFYIQ